MQPFDYVLARSARAAIESAADADGAAFIAGGTDLMQLMKEGAAAPRRLVDVNPLPCTEITLGAQGLRLGALARMSDVADDPGVRERFPVSRRRCWRARPPRCATWPRSAATCCSAPAAPTSATRPCPATSALRAPAAARSRAITACTRSSAAASAASPRTHRISRSLWSRSTPWSWWRGQAARRIPIGEFHRLPGNTPERDTVLEPGELILAVEVPASAAARRSHYLKIRDRASFEFALVSVAAGLDVGDGAIRAARLAAGGVGTKPWRLHTAEAALAGRPPTPETYQAAADRAVEGASPLLMNGFKVELLRRGAARATAGDLA